MQPTQYQHKKSFTALRIFTALFVVACVFVAGFVVGDKGYLNQSQNLTTASNVNTQQGLPKDLDYEDVEQVYDIVRKNYDGELSEEQFLTELKSAIARATGDPYTEFFTQPEAVEFNQELDGTFTGIGAELGKKDGNLIVVSPLSGYPAEAAGLRPQDVIARIDGEDSIDISVFEAVSKIRGPEGTDVTLTLVRNNTEVVEVTITRQLIDAPSVTRELNGNVGIIRISQFSGDTSGLVEQFSKELLADGATSIVLDMRGNPGGFLDQAVKVAGVWLDDGLTVVEVRKGDKVLESYDSNGSSRLKGVPTVVLINEGSASASEIVAGALQDYEAAQVVGKQSFGKGSVQNISELSGGELLKITTSRWYTPNGNNIDKEGISPNIEVERTEEDFNSGADPQLDKAIELLGEG